MKKISGWLAAFACIGIAAVPASRATTYLGNGGSGFGGPVGNGNLSVTDDGLGNIIFALNAGSTFNSNALIIYVDSKAGGVNDTSTFTDTSDGGREAISGENPGNPSRTLATFAPGFGADYAITVEPGVFSGLFDLSTPSNFGFVASGNLSGSGSGPFTFSFTRAQLGLGPTAPFSFEGTLISTTAYRSNETIGTSVTTPGTAGDAPNAGFNGTTTFIQADVFSVPEPGSLVLLTVAGLGMLRRRRRGA